MTNFVAGHPYIVIMFLSYWIIFSTLINLVAYSARNKVTPKPFENAKLAEAIQMEFAKRYMQPPYNVVSCSVNLADGSISYSLPNNLACVKIENEFMGLKTVRTGVGKPEKY